MGIAGVGAELAQVSMAKPSAQSTRVNIKAGDRIDARVVDALGSDVSGVNRTVVADSAAVLDIAQQMKQSI